MREAPALTLIRRALGFGATCRAFDPVATETARAELGTQPMLTLATDMYDAATGADALVVCTDWDDFKSPEFEQLRKLLKSPVIFDGRNLYRTADLRRLGFHYISVGRQPIKPNA